MHCQVGLMAALAGAAFARPIVPETIPEVDLVQLPKLDMSMDGSLDLPIKRQVIPDLDLQMDGSLDLPIVNKRQVIEELSEFDLQMDGSLNLPIINKRQVQVGSLTKTLDGLRILPIGKLELVDADILNNELPRDLENLDLPVEDNLVDIDLLNRPAKREELPELGGDVVDLDILNSGLPVDLNSLDLPTKRQELPGLGDNLVELDILNNGPSVDNVDLPVRRELIDADVLNNGLPVDLDTFHLPAKRELVDADILNNELPVEHLPLGSSADNTLEGLTAPDEGSTTAPVFRRSPPSIECVKDASGKCKSSQPEVEDFDLVAYVEKTIPV